MINLFDSTESDVPPPRTMDNDGYDDVFIAEMLAAAKLMASKDPVMARRLDKILQGLIKSVDYVADLSDQSFIAYLKLYPMWLSYIQDANPECSVH